MEEPRAEKRRLPKPLPADDALRRRRIGALLSLAVFAAFMLFAAWAVGRPLLRFIGEPARFRAWVDGRGALGQFAMVGMAAVQVIVALIPSEALELGAGYAFGAWQGAFLCLAGIVLGSVIVILAVQKLGMRIVTLFYTREQIASASFLQNTKRLRAVVFVLFLIPGTPKDLLTYLIGLTPVSLPWYVVFTSVARFPSIIMSTVAGAAAGEQAYGKAILLFAVGAAVGLTGFLLYGAFVKGTKRR